MRQILRSPCVGPALLLLWGCTAGTPLRSNAGDARGNTADGGGDDEGMSDAKPGDGDGGSGDSGAPCPVIQTVAETVVAPGVSYFATFNSHNQKVVANDYGIFLSYVPQRYLIDGTGGEPVPGTTSTWLLMRSRDGGSTFNQIAGRTNVLCQAPTIDTDREGYLYLMYTESYRHDTVAKFARYSPASDYAVADRTANVGHASGGKYAIHYDPQRAELYYFVNISNSSEWFPYPALYTLSRDAADIHGVFSMLDGATASIEYPYLAVGGGKLFAAWTTEHNDRYLYWDIHFVVSDNGGQYWRNLAGGWLDLPVVADDGGPTTNLVPPNELDVHTWLGNMLYKDGKLHFMYRAADVMHYMRYDVATGIRDRDVQPEWRGRDISVRSMSGFFVTDSRTPGSPLFAVSLDLQGRLAVLKSRDNGSTWEDHALGRSIDLPTEEILFLGGFRELTADGHIIGSYTLLNGPPGVDSGQRLSDLPTPHSKLVFFKVSGACP